MKVQIDKTYSLPCSAEIAWEFLQNVEAVAACMPGAKITERVDADRYKGTVTTKVGPATMSFRGEVQIMELRAVLKMRGVDDAKLARLQAPAGPDAGAKTPGEIALVAIAGVLASLRGRGEPDERKAAAGAGPDVITPILRTEPGIASAVAIFINPVCGVAVSRANALHVENYAGVSYYFCCDGCWTTFLKDPGKYAAIHQISAGAVPAGEHPHATD
jgi:YHS domain-containing protein